MDIKYKFSKNTHTDIDILKIGGCLYYKELIHVVKYTDIIIK